MRIDKCAFFFFLFLAGSTGNNLNFLNSNGSLLNAQQQQQPLVATVTGNPYQINLEYGMNWKRGKTLEMIMKEDARASYVS